MHIQCAQRARVRVITRRGTVVYFCGTHLKFWVARNQIVRHTAMNEREKAFALMLQALRKWIVNDDAMTNLDVDDTERVMYHVAKLQEARALARQAIAAAEKVERAG